MNITEFIINLSSLIGALGVISAFVIRILKRMFKETKETISDLDIRECKIFLNGFLNSVKSGEVKDEEEWRLAHDIYDHYTKELHQNSYIHDKWDRIINHK